MWWSNEADASKLHVIFNIFIWLFDQIISGKFFLDYLQKWKTWAVSVGKSQVCPGYSGLSLFPPQRKHRSRWSQTRQHSLVQSGRRLQIDRLRSGLQCSGGGCPSGPEWRWVGGRERCTSTSHKIWDWKNCTNGLHAHCTFIPDCWAWEREGLDKTTPNLSTGSL